MDKIRRKFLWGSTQEKRAWAKVKWDTICRPRNKGGLGIANLEIRNKALLSKWWWRYGRETNSLWRRMIEAVYEKDIQEWRSADGMISRASKVWGPILNLKHGANTKQLVGDEEFRWSIGNESSILFWWDRWSSDKPLKEIFLRLFSLSTKKLMKMDEAVDLLSDGGTRFNAVFRRHLRVWENEELDKLKVMVMDINLVENSKDTLVWSGSSDGKFSTRRATKILFELIPYQQRFKFDFIWKIPVPAKVQTFLWLLIMDRIPSKRMLIDRKVIPASAEAACSHCGFPDEDNNHLLLLCPVVFETWKEFFVWWKIERVLPNQFAVLFNFLFATGSNSYQLKCWRLAVDAAVWTIWQARNDATFNNKKWSAGELLFTIKLRSWHWFNVLLSKNENATTEWWTNPGETNNSGDDQAASSWVPPAQGWVKFNTDALVNIADGKAGIGGVLRDSEGRVNALFANTWSVEEVDKVELEAIRVALRKAVKLKDQAGANVVIESDSSLAVSWCLAPTTRPVLFERVFEEIDKSIQSLASVVIQHVNRNKNGFADSLTRMGRKGTSNRFLSWVI